jgi:hypothetical protein
MSLNTLAPTPIRHRGAALGGRSGPPAPTELPVLVSFDGAVIPIRRRAAITLGGLARRQTTSGRQLVTAHDINGASWWIPADAVWTDVEQAGPSADREPDVPQPIGLATAESADQAVLAGLSDRLGWEAADAFEGGAHLPIMDIAVGREDVVVLDGRLGHGVPTVVILGERILRWAAGATWQLAVHRALYQTRGDGADVELKRLAATLDESDLLIASVDLGTALLRRSGVFRRSVQLVAAGDDAGRTWDAGRVD